MKKKKDNLYSKQYSLAKEREKYATNVNFKEKKKESSRKGYQKLKEKQAEQKEKEEIDSEKIEARRSFEYKKSVAKGMNSLYRKKMQWLIDCFDHLFENFPHINKKVKSEMISIGKSIDEKQEKVDWEIEEILKKVEDSEDSMEIWKAFKGEKIENSTMYKEGKEQTDIQHEWNIFEWWEIGGRMKNILVEIEGSRIGTDWYSIIQTIQERYEENHSMVLDKQKYTTNKFCFICKKEPNCLEKNWLTKEEHHMVLYGSQSKFWKHSEAYLELI